MHTTGTLARRRGPTSHDGRNTAVAPAPAPVAVAAAPAAVISVAREASLHAKTRRLVREPALNDRETAPWGQRNSLSLVPLDFPLTWGHRLGVYN